MSNNNQNSNQNNNASLSNKILSQGSSFTYFKKIGKKRGQYLFLNILVVFGAIAGTPYILRGIEEKTLDVEMEIDQIKQESDLLNAELIEVKDLRKDLEEQKVVENEFDITLNVFDTLARVEDLMLKSGFNNTKHEVGQLNYLSDHVELPVNISIIGNYFDIINFLEEVKTWEHSPALRNFELAVNEESYDSLKVGDKMEVTFDLILYSRLPVSIDNAKQFFKGENKFVNPFGYITYTTNENAAAEGLSEYQRTLEEYFKRINGGTSPTDTNNGGTLNPDGTSNQNGSTNNSGTLNPDGTTNQNGSTPNTNGENNVNNPNNNPNNNEPNPNNNNQTNPNSNNNTNGSVTSNGNTNSNGSNSSKGKINPDGTITKPDGTIIYAK